MAKYDEEGAKDDHKGDGQRDVLEGCGREGYGRESWERDRGGYNSGLFVTVCIRNVGKITNHL